MRRWVFWVALASLTGCARLDYVKVPSPTQYDHWSDAQQAQADKMKGVRYYLPRPFVNLKQSVPVAQRVAFISFNYDETSGSYLLTLPDNAPFWVRRVAPRKLSVAQAIAANVVSPGPGNQTKSGAGAGNFQAGSVGGDTNSPSSSASNAPAPETPAQTMTASTGYINDTDPVTKLGPIMDVVYLPDFDEQYVIQPHVGFAGQAEIETKLRNGWAAETFQQKVDNSQLIPYVIRQVEHASDTAAKIATTWLPTATLGLPPNTSLADMMKFAKSGAGGFQSGEVSVQDAKEFLGKALLFKIAEVRVAQPGIYPILKEREIRSLFHGKKVLGPVIDPEDNLELALQQADLPWIRPDMAFIPCPPFTVVGFNTTIDVFLVAATDRISVGTVDNRISEDRTNNPTPPQLSKDDELKKTIKAALLSGLKTADKDELKAVSEQNVLVSPQPNATTQVTLASASGKPFKKSDGAAYLTWLATALKLKPGVNVATPPSPTDTFETLILTIQAPASGIVEGLGK